MADALADWLALREPADAAARSLTVTQAAARAVAGRDPLQVLELGTGTGANIRYLAPRLGGRQRWLAVDRSADLLALLPARLSHWADAQGYDVDRAGSALLVRAPRFECHVDTRAQDLDALDPGLFAGRQLVTGSAMLDLVSERWLRSLAERCARADAAALFALTYAGRSSCTPPEPEDDWVCDLLNRHQHRDKGLGGPAAGPAAADAAVRAFADAGYDTATAPAHWQLGAGDGGLQRQLVDGWAHAALEMAPAEAAVIEAWRARRHAHLDAARSRIIVEHADVAAWPHRDRNRGTRL